MSNLVLDKYNRDNKKEIVDIDTIVSSFSFIKTQIRFSCFVASKDEKGNYTPVFMNHSCRSYMGEAIFQLKALKFFSKTSSYNREGYTPKQCLSTFDYLTGDTHIGVVNASSYVDTFITNFDRLNKIEEEFGIPLSSYEIMENYPNVVIVTGSGLWKDSCWKIQLYTYMIKTLFYDVNDTPEADYLKLIKKNYKQLFGNIKMKPEEEIFDVPLYERDVFYRHTMTGFVSICQGLNKSMADLLDIKIDSKAKIYY